MTVRAAVQNDPPDHPHQRPRASVQKEIQNRPEWRAGLQPYRALFGDESFDYATALQQHYENGPPADWPQQFVSA